MFIKGLKRNFLRAPKVDRGTASKTGAELWPGVTVVRPGAVDDDLEKLVSDALKTVREPAERNRDENRP